MHCFLLQSLKKEMDWERSTEERSASSEISADYRLPPDPVSLPFSGESSIYIYLYFQFIIDYFLFSYPLFALHFYTYIYIPIYTYILLITVIVPLIRNRRQEWHAADETTMYCCAKSLQVATAITHCDALCIVFYVIIIIKSRQIVRNVLPGEDGRDFQTRTASRYVLDKRMYFASPSESPTDNRIRMTRAHARAYVCVCAEFTLHVGLLHVPKCFAVCCSPPLI